jgi:hypothetical protein
VSVADKLEELEKKREARRKLIDEARAEQYVVDMTALDELEEKHGADRVKALKVKAFTPGLPTMVIIKSSAGESYHKRFVDMVRKAKGNKDAEAQASNMLARSSVVYPEKDVLQAMSEAYPNMWTDIANAAVKLVMLEEEDEKKG